MCHETLDGRMVAVVHESHGNTRNQSHVCTDSVVYRVSSSFRSHIASDCGGAAVGVTVTVSRAIFRFRKTSLFPHSDQSSLSLSHAHSLSVFGLLPLQLQQKQQRMNPSIQQQRSTQWVPLVTLRMCTERAIAAVGEHSNAMYQCWKLERMCRSSSN